MDLPHFQQVNVTGTTGLVGTTTIDNITFNDNTIATSSNADLNITPGGTGTVNVSNLTIDSKVNITDNNITILQSISALVLSGERDRIRSDGKGRHQ